MAAPEPYATPEYHRLQLIRGRSDSPSSTSALNDSVSKEQRRAKQSSRHAERREKGKKAGFVSRSPDIQPQPRTETDRHVER